MNRRFSSTILLTLALTWTALAQSQSPMREGNWEATTKINMPGMPTEMPPMKHVQCLTAADIKNPQGSLPPGPGGSDCKVSNYKYSGNTATYTMVCTTPTPMTAVGEMKYSGTDAYTGTIVMDTGGQKMTVSYDAKRIGDCPKTK